MPRHLPLKSADGPFLAQGATSRDNRHESPLMSAAARLGFESQRDGLRGWLLTGLETFEAPSGESRQN
jgi:hypothetical protein